MARTEFTVYSVVSTGVTATYSSGSTDGNKFDNTGVEFLHVINAATSDSRTVEIVPTFSLDGNDLEHKQVTLTAATSSTIPTEMFMGTWKPSVYNQTSGTDVNMVYVNYITSSGSTSYEDDLTGLTIAVLGR